MKKLMRLVITAVISLSFVPMQLNAVTGISLVSTATTIPVESAEANALTTRLIEIKAIDKSELSANEKKQLRKEVRTIKKDLKRASGGIYFSAGAIIIIVLLLILLL